jgi:tRNA threonylcarbamoyl adenosine modification protein YjeE
MNLAKTLCLKHWKGLQTRPLMFLLIGELGAGKTVFAKGIGEFLRINQPITSPTFTIEREYDYSRHGIKGRFLHLDTWRLHHLQEFNQLHLEKQFKPKTIIAIEWANRTLSPLIKMAKQSRAILLSVSFSINNLSHNRRNLKIRSYS